MNCSLENKCYSDRDQWSDELYQLYSGLNTENTVFSFYLWSIKRQYRQEIDLKNR